MPRVDWDTEVEWDRFYGHGGASGYSRDWATAGGSHPLDGLNWKGQENHYAQLATAYAAQGIGATDRILIVGSGLGFTIEILNARGFSNIVGVEKSPAVRGHADWDGSQVSVAADFSQASGAQVRNAIRSAFGSLGFSGNQRDPEWVITEAVLESYDDADVTTLLGAAEAVVDGPDSQIIHAVMTLDAGPWTGPDAGVFNEKMGADWKALAPTHTWISYEHPEVVF